MTDTDLTKMSDLELAQYKQGCREDDPRVVLVEREFARRDRHEQTKLIKYGIRIGAIYSLLGAIVGALIAVMLPIWLKGCLLQEPKTKPETKEIPPFTQQPAEPDRE